MLRKSGKSMIYSLGLLSCDEFVQIEQCARHAQHLLPVVLSLQNAALVLVGMPRYAEHESFVEPRGNGLRNLIHARRESLGRFIENGVVEQIERLQRSIRTAARACMWYRNPARRSS